MLNSIDLTKYRSLALFLLRLMIAAIFLSAGYAKLMFWSPLPEGMTMSVGMVNLMKFLSVVEPLGAVALVLGILNRWAALGLGIIMVGAVALMQFMMGVGFMTPTGPGWAFPLMILGGCMILVVYGGGKWSLWR